MDDQITFYSITEINCKCGETDTANSMYRCDIPCSHRFHLIQKFPKLTDLINLKIFGNTEKLEFEYEATSLTTRLLERSEIDNQVFRAVQTIRRFSHFKNKIEIRKFVQDTMKYKDVFVYGQSISLLQTICKGIKVFSSKAKNEDKLMDSDGFLADIVVNEAVENNVFE